MNRKFLILLSILISLYSCKTYKANSITKTNLKLNKADLNRLKRSKDRTVSYSKANQDITLSDASDSYQEVISNKSTPYNLINIYYKTSLSLKSQTMLFYRAATGITKEYNEKGALIKQTNLDESYPFTVDSLVLKIKTEFNIDLMVPGDKTVNRDIDDSSKKVVFDVRIMIGPQTFRFFRIDATNGNVISNTIGHYIE